MPKPGSFRHLTFATNPLLSNCSENKTFNANWHFSSKLFMGIKFLKIEQVLA